MMFHGRSVLLVVGLGFGVAPFLGGLYRLPRWIRFGLTMCGISLFVGAVVGIILDIFRPDLSEQTEFFLYSHELILYGIGLGIILLLIFSGEIFKALRVLGAERKK
ncbi:MAG TPA: hypothetical protein VGW97_00435 [Chthoniobacterales bacterium]|jgi:hypothetical protein|nr:hypothetical protein [Chthoniobacterales bacterium]